MAFPARADLLDYILGAHRASPPPAFPSSRPAPAWEATLTQGTPESGKLLYTTGQSTEPNRKVVVCQSCHGVGAVPDVQAPMPRLAGVTADYIAKQLDDYRSNRRQNEQMGQIARSMSPSDIGSVSLYLASLSPSKKVHKPAPGNDLGRHLQQLGDNARAIPACGNCHGPQGRGTDQLLPPLAGLSAVYLRAQLREWRSGERHNDDEGVMRNVASKLTDDEIASLAEYYASMR
eukprot:gene1486-1508_t